MYASSLTDMNLLQMLLFSELLEMQGQGKDDNKMTHGLYTA